MLSWGGWFREKTGVAEILWRGGGERGNAERGNRNPSSLRYGETSAEIGTGNAEAGCRNGNGDPLTTRRLPGKCKAALLGLVPTWLKLQAGNMRDTAKLARLFREHPLDVMHVNVNGYETAGPACRRARIPSLGVYHNTFIPEEYWFRRWLIRQNIRSYAHVCCVAPRSRDMWQRATGIPSDRIAAVWNGIDLDRFHPRDRHIRANAAGSLKLISIGRLSSVKGYNFLVEAIRLLDDDRVSLELLGRGEQEEDLRSLTRRLSLEDRVTFVGHVEDVEVHLRAADAFVLVSVAHESCPLVIPEAMACGLPVITSDFGALPDMNIDGETGLVVPAGDSAALALAVRRLADDPALASRMGAAARRRAQELFSEDRMVSETMKLYESLAGRQRRRVPRFRHAKREDERCGTQEA